MIMKLSYSLALNLARSPATSPETLKQLANYNSFVIPHRVMNHPNATEEVIMIAKATHFVLFREWEL
jgi:hypothetical protein